MRPKRRGTYRPQQIGSETVQRNGDQAYGRDRREIKWISVCNRWTLIHSFGWHPFWNRRAHLGNYHKEIRRQEARSDRQSWDYLYGRPLWGLVLFWFCQTRRCVR